MIWRNDVFLTLDAETTGLDMMEDRMIEVSLLMVDVAGNVLTPSYSTRINPEGDFEIKEEAQAIHGISEEDLKDYPSSNEVMKKVQVLLRTGRLLGFPLVIANAPFDWALLQLEFRRAGLQIIEDVNIIDPMVIDRYFDRFRKGSRTLIDLAMYYCTELDLDEDRLHTAFYDAFLSERVAREVLFVHDLYACSLKELHASQMVWYEENQKSLNEYFKRKQIDKVAQGKWPLGILGDGENIIDMEF